MALMIRWNIGSIYTVSIGSSGTNKRKISGAKDTQHRRNKEDYTLEHIRLQNMLSEKNHLIRAFAHTE